MGFNTLRVKIFWLLMFIFKEVSSAHCIYLSKNSNIEIFVLFKTDFYFF